ncbi:MAG: phosphoribosylformylglycinamidine synthase subunit PurQ [Fimbriimonadaceae bacterium]|nr:phosphoribosylformylglycinamidine synthase subunit PurQ [Fimbriimonadaceae bacterium]
MKFAVVRFPGSNCDEDALQGLRDAGHVAEYAWHENSDLSSFDAVWVPGGFSYGDYLRCGAIAARSPVMESVRAAAAAGAPVIGVCNGFQILCESGLLPGALVRNSATKFVCKDVWLRPEGVSEVWPVRAVGLIRIPIAHGEGRFVAHEEELRRLEGEGRVAFRYVDSHGERTPVSNPNGSVHDIAGIFNEGRNVLGMMPHPERATRPSLGSKDGLGLLRVLNQVQRT